MGIAFWIAFGILAGSLAKLVMPGPSAGGVAVAIPIGIAGAVAGGLIAAALGVGSMATWDFGGMLMAFTGAVGILFLYRCCAMRAMA